VYWKMAEPFLLDEVVLRKIPESKICERGLVPPSGMAGENVQLWSRDGVRNLIQTPGAESARLNGRIQVFGC
jgi:hypothetical protein